MNKEKCYPMAKCYLCEYRYTRELKNTQYVEPYVFASICLATKKEVICKKRNKQGICKYFSEMDETYTGG